MSTILIFAFVAIVLIGVLGVIGRRRPVRDLSEWTVGGRRYGAFTMWFLQAGEVFTTFTFLGLAGLAFSGGVAVFYSLPYIPLGYAVLFFLARRVWTLGKQRGYLTQGDFLEDRFDSKLLGTLSAIIGVVFVLPYLQLQITGLGLIVNLVTGDATSATLSMVIGCLFVIVFVLWTGLRGVASTSYFKDAIMLIVLVVLVIAIPTHFAGGISGIFHKVAQLHPSMLVLHAGSHDQTWFITNMFVSAIGVGFICLPHSWPGIFAAKSPKALRRNYAFLPLYELTVLIPIIIGFAAILVLSPKTNPNGILLSLSQHTLPTWATGFVVMAGIATAMVPAAGILIAISSLVARNIARVRNERLQFWVNHGTVVVAVGFSLLLGIFLPNALANLLLLTYTGLCQLAPANILGLTKRRLVGKVPVIVGMVAGIVVVILLTFVFKTLFGTFDVGLVGLGVNLVIVAVGAGIERMVGATPQQRPETSDSDGNSDDSDSSEVVTA
ncbi:MAG TPA: sodium:solute symporter family protein [Pseudonocardiaceae bacterium]|jgi:SSS family solute:Na+ symporter|nr:sodium:solute symporter family protein [Pseudonocardiaceae bacterium]